MEKWKKIIPVIAVCLIVGLTVCYFAFWRNTDSTVPNQTSDQGDVTPAEPKTDSDGDGLSDQFELNIADLDPLVPNDRYAVVLSTQTIHPNPYYTNQRREETTNVKTFLIEEEEFEPENIFLLMDKEATYDNFESAIGFVANVSDENDLVYIMIEGHGSENGFAFHSGKDPSEVEITDEYLETVRDMYAWGYDEYWEQGGREEARTDQQIWIASCADSISPEELSESLNRISCKRMLFTIECCGGRGFVDNMLPIENMVIIGRQSLHNIADTLIRSVVAPDAIYRELSYQTEEYRNRESSLIKLDDGNTYPSITEVLAADLIDHLIIQWRELCEENGLDCEKLLAMTDVAQIIEYITTFESNLKEITAKIIDPQEIADDFYFGEAEIGEYRDTDLYELSP